MDNEEKEKKSLEVVDESTEEEKAEETPAEKEKKKIDSQEEQIKKLEEELQAMIEDMKTVMGDDAVPDIKVMAAPPVSKKKRFLFGLIEILISILTIVALTGYIKWIKCDKIYFYFINMAVIIVIEFVLSWLIKRFGLKLIIYSFGAISYVPPIIGFLIVGIFAFGAETLDVGKTVLVGILYIIIKKLIMWLIKGAQKPIQIKEIKK